MELEKKGNKWSISSWDGSKLGSNGRMKYSKLPKIIIVLSVILSIVGCSFMGFSLLLWSKNLTVTGMIFLFIAVVLFFVGEILKESQKVNEKFKFVKDKFKKDDFYDN